MTTFVVNVARVRGEEHKFLLSPSSYSHTHRVREQHLQQISDQTTPTLFRLPVSGFADFDAYGDAQALAIQRCSTSLGIVRVEIGRLSQVIDPANKELSRLRSQIMATHEWPLFDSNARRRRRPLFAALDAMATKWGPMRQRLRKLKQHEKELINELQRLRRAKEQTNGL